MTEKYDGHRRSPGSLIRHAVRILKYMVEPWTTRGLTDNVDMGDANSGQNLRELQEMKYNQATVKAILKLVLIPILWIAGGIGHARRENKLSILDGHLPPDEE